MTRTSRSGSSSTDVDLVVNVRAAGAGDEGNLHWEWSDDVSWDPKVTMKMSSETANKYFQGKENVAMADRAAADQDRRRREGGPVHRPDHQARVRPVPRMLEPDYPHLVA